MNIRDYYQSHLSHLETPEFVAWFEGWYGDESSYSVSDGALLEAYWGERRFALLGWHAAHLPANVSANKFRFVRSIQEKQ